MGLVRQRGIKYILLSKASWVSSSQKERRKLSQSCRNSASSKNRGIYPKVFQTTPRPIALFGVRRNCIRTWTHKHLYDSVAAFYVRSNIVRNEAMRCLLYYEHLGAIVALEKSQISQSSNSFLNCDIVKTQSSRRKSILKRQINYLIMKIWIIYRGETVLRNSFGNGIQMKNTRRSFNRLIFLKKKHRFSSCKVARSWSCDCEANGLRLEFRTLPLHDQNQGTFARSSRISKNWQKSVIQQPFCKCDPKEKQRLAKPPQ